MLPAANSWRSSAALQSGSCAARLDTSAWRQAVHAFAVNGNLDIQTVASNTFEMEWPPKSGGKQVFPEIDRAGWFDLPVAQAKILEGQRPLLDRLAELVRQSGARPA